MKSPSFSTIVVLLCSMILPVAGKFQFNDNFKIIDNDSYGGEGITLEPKSGKTITGTFIWIHGLRNTAVDSYVLLFYFILFYIFDFIVLDYLCIEKIMI